MAFASVLDNFPIAGQQSRAHVSSGGYDDAVGWIAVEWLRQVAAFDGDFGRQGSNGQARDSQCLLHPEAAGEAQLDAAFRFQQCHFPYGDDGYVKPAAGSGCLNGSPDWGSEHPGLAVLQPDPEMRIEQQGNPAITSHRRIPQTTSRRLGPQCRRGFSLCPSSVRKWLAVLRPEEPVEPRACRAS